MDEARWERMERTMEFLLNQQTDADARARAADERSRANDLQIQEILRVQSGHQDLMEMLISNWDTTRRTVDQLAVSVRELRITIEELREAQRHTDERLNALIGFVDHKLGGSPLN